MDKYFEIKILKNAELALRICMSVAMLTAGISKFFSKGAFREYYLGQFTRDTLRIQLPEIMPYIMLHSIPFIEVSLGLLILIPKTRRFFSMAFVFYILMLTVGHYIMEEFIDVDVVLPLAFFGIVAYILPAYSSYKEIFIKKKDL